MKEKQASRRFLQTIEIKRYHIEHEQKKKKGMQGERRDLSKKKAHLTIGVQVIISPFFVASDRISSLTFCFRETVVRRKEK